MEQALKIAYPLRSEDAEAAVEEVLGTVLVPVSEICTSERGILRASAATMVILEESDAWESFRRRKLHTWYGDLAPSQSLHELRGRSRHDRYEPRLLLGSKIAR